MTTMKGEMAEVEKFGEVPGTDDGFREKQGVLFG